MNKNSLLLSLGSLLTLPLPVMAAMTEMADSELAKVSGQAYVVEFGRYERTVSDLSERDIVIGTLDVSGAAQAIEMNYPQLTDLVRQGTVTATNTALISGKTIVIASVASVPGVGTLAAPILSLLPTPTIRFE
ncbi:MAG TPA: hypothetical protein VFK46_08890 [Candidatus Macondimonas sp.]|nr:hypothetical protein [Candidatus Macondimonas sp.]